MGHPIKSYRGFKVGGKALYDGRVVTIKDLRSIAGGVAADVREEPGHNGLMDYTTAADNLKPVAMPVTLSGKSTPLDVSHGTKPESAGQEYIAPTYEPLGSTPETGQALLIDAIAAESKRLANLMLNGHLTGFKFDTRQKGLLRIGIETSENSDFHKISIRELYHPKRAPGEILEYIVSKKLFMLGVEK